MAIQSDETLVTKGDLKTLYSDKILPYLGGNMMMQTGVSDYYSTDEKIVGVWTDGKPVYQKVINFTTPSAANTETSIVKVANGADANLVDLEIYVYGGAYTIPMFCHPTASNFVYGFLSNSYLCVNVAAPYINKSAMAIIKYTKTTDAADAALTTPGCYDLNRPDLWPENKEIFFGNGLYGYRATGNMPALAAGTDWTNIRMLTNIGTNGKTFQMGGGLETLNANGVRAWTQLGISRSGNFESTLVVSTNGELQLGVKFPGTSHHSTTANKYDVWVTYTK